MVRTKSKIFLYNVSFCLNVYVGARRKHRDYVMLAMLKSGLIDTVIVTYRDVFVGGDCTSTPRDGKNNFQILSVQWPYVSPNLDPTWEVRDMDNSVSGLVPWEIYNRTWYSVVVETLGYGTVCFLMEEKIAKCFQARRLFVVLPSLDGRLTIIWGFETFDSMS
jgi:hypothetical protein